MKKLSFLVTSLLIFFSFLDHTPVHADWINFSGAQNAPNIAEIYINKDHVKLDLEIYVDDVMTFDRLMPDESFEDSDIKRPPLADRMREFSDKDAVAVLDSLLKNTYRSFDFREEEDVYDRLATSVSGNLLSDIYLQNRKSLVVTQAGNARARVKEVEVLDVDVSHLDDRPLGLLFRATWTAMGSVGHWGHIHVRKNQYNANITVEPVDGTWKITDLELLEEKRIDVFGEPRV